MSYKPYNPTETTPLTTPPVPNPHSPGQHGYRQTPVDIPGVLHQTRELFRPYTGTAEKDNNK